MGIYFYTTLLAGVIGLTLAVLLAGLQISAKKGLQKYSRARWCLVGAFGVFGMMNLMEASLDGTTGEGTGDFAGVLAIVVGSLLAMLFTMTVLAFIRPEIVNRKQILAQLALIVPPCVLLIILRLYASEPVFKVFFWFMLAAYLLLMALYTRLFVKSYRTFKSRMLAFYEEEDLVGQLQWINWTFWLGLAVGIAALLFLVDSPVTGSFLNVVFSVCFLLMYVFFVNYRPYAVMVDCAVKDKSMETAPPQIAGESSKYLSDKQLAKAIDSWIEKKGYLDNTKSVKEIAHEMGFYYPVIKDYIQATTGEDFRSWRIRLRVQEAMRLMAEKPDILISDLVFMTGFNDRAYFYRTFQKITGKTIREYRDSLWNTHMK